MGLYYTARGTPMSTINGPLITLISTVVGSYTHHQGLLKLAWLDKVLMFSDPGRIVSQRTTAKAVSSAMHCFNLP